MKPKLAILLIVAAVPLTGCAGQKVWEKYIPCATAPGLEELSGMDLSNTNHWYSFTSLAEVKEARRQMSFNVKVTVEKFKITDPLARDDIKDAESLGAKMFALISALITLLIGGPVAHKLGLNKIGPNQVAKEEHEAKVKQAGLEDPEEFKSKLYS